MKKRILIIEDNGFMKILLKNLFEPLFDVYCKSNGHEALDWLNEGNTPDIILSDLLMPEMGGLEFLKNVRDDKSYQNIPLVMLSGVEKSKDRIQCLQMGANDFLIKPFNPVELTIRIQNLLKSA